MRSRAASNRRLGAALAISILAHALVLSGGVPLPREPFREPPAPPPLLTRLVELPASAPEPPTPPPPAPKKREKPRVARKEVQKPETPGRPAPIAEAAPAAQPATPAPVASPAASPAPSPAPRVDTRAAEAASAAQYRQQLIDAARRHKPPYPLEARENNWTGDVLLEIVLRADGRAELGLRRGSGHALLDRLALDTYQEALRTVPVPAALQGRQVRLEPLRVIYNLTE